MPKSHTSLSELQLMQMDLLLYSTYQYQIFLGSNNIEATIETNFWSYIWGTPYFSSVKAYVHLTGHRVIHNAFKWLWKSSCQNKHKVFFWLLLKDRLSTREILKRRNMYLPDYSFVCYGQVVEESLEHLFIQCHFCKGTLECPGIIC